MEKTDIGKYIKPVPAGHAKLTAAGSGWTGPTVVTAIDTMGYDSGKLSLDYLATVAATGATMAIAIDYQTSVDNSNWETAVSVYDAVEITGPSTNTVDIIEYDINLDSKPQYIKFNITPTLSAYTGTATDSLTYMAQFIKGGPDTVPAV